MQGDLSGINLAELLLELHLSGRTGILRLTQGEVKKGIYFKDGAIVFAHSNLNTDRLGETLLRLGKITEDEFRIASVDVVELGKRLGRSLHESGFLSLSEVNAGVRYQLQQIVYSVFNWDSGTYDFIDRERPVFEDIMVDVSTPDLLVEGIRHISNLAVLDRVVGADDGRIVQPNVGGVRLARTNLDTGEETVVRCLGEKATIARLRSLSRLRPIEFGKAIYSLLISGLIHIGPSDTAEEQTEAVESKAAQEPFATQRMKAISAEQLEKKPQRSPLKTYSQPEIRRLIVQTEKDFQEMTDEEVLGVLPDCTKNEIEEAYRKQISIFHPPLHSEDRYIDVKTKLKFISDRLSQARERMMDKLAARMPFTGEIDQPLYGEAPGASDLVRAEPAETRTVEATMQSPVLSAAAEALAATHDDPKATPVPTRVLLADFVERIRKNPGNTPLLRLYALKLREAGKAVEAEKQLLRALEIEPQNVENHFALADFYQQQGLKIKAFRHLNIILQLQPDNERAMELMSVKKRKKPLYEISRD